MTRSFVRLDQQSDAFVQKMASNGRQFVTGLGIMGAGITGLSAAFTAAQTAGKFEGAMANLRVVSGATTEQMEKFRAAILGADQSIYGPVETAHALQELAQRGFTARQALEMLKPVTDLATASLGQLGLESAAEVATMAIHGFGLKAEDTTRVVDEMAKAANMSGMAFKDLPMGIGAIARGATAANQTFEEAIITLGMMRNQIHSIERASNAGSVAMERMVSGVKGSKALQAMVDVFDKATGQVRPFRQIVNDLIPKLDAMGVKASKAFIIKAFGTRGLAGIQAVITQLKNGVETADGQILRGMDLINYQNEQLANASGTAAKIMEERLKTLPGQMELIKASWERLMVVVGGPFAEALKPVTATILKFMNFVKNTFEGMPENVKKGIAQFFLLGSALATVFGALLAGKALMALFGVTFGAIASAAASLIVPILAVGGAIAGVILMFKAFQIHSEQTGKGVIGFFVDMGRKVSLAFKGLMQLFQEGAFSGEVMMDLNKAENSGVKSFAIKLFLWVNRIKNFLVGMWDGFKAGIRDLEPVFTRLTDALGLIASAFGLSVGPANDNMAAWQQAGSAGQSLGETLSRVAAIAANVLTTGLMAAYGAMEVFKAGWIAVGPLVTNVASMVWGALQLIIGVLSGDWTMAWKGAINMVYGLLGGLMHMISRVAGIFASLFDSINKVVGIKSTFAEDLAFGTKEIDKFLAANKTEALNMAGVNPAATAPSAAVVPPPTAASSPGVAIAQATSGGLGLLGLGQMAMSKQQAAPQTINLTSVLKWDNETLARIQQQIKTDAQARGFAVGAAQ